MISIQIHITDLPFDGFVENLMHRRVAQGWPESVNFKWPNQHEGYTWTDGIDSILSLFFLLDSGDIQEIQISDAGR